MTARKKVIKGGTYAGKTHGIIPVLIDRAIKEPKITITCVSETIPAVRDGCVKIFKEVMDETNRWIDDHWIGNPMEYTFSNGSVIQFKSFDTVGKAKASGKRDILFLNECNHIEFEVAHMLMARSNETYMDYNPDLEFWVDTEILTGEDVEFVILTYLDNEAIPDSAYAELMERKEKAKTSEYWANWWRVYGEGKTGNIVVDNRFAHDFDDSHIYECQFQPHIPLIISMDFNIEPFAFVFSQVWQDNLGWHWWIFDESTIKSGTIPKAIEDIKKKYGPYLWNCIITGDYNGNKKEMSQIDHASNYEQIRRGLKLHARQIQARPNPKHKNSRTDLNFCLYHSSKDNPAPSLDFRIDPRCEFTIQDMRYVEADGQGNIVKSNRKEKHQRADHMDAVRYLAHHKKIQDWIKWRQKQPF